MAFLLDEYRRHAFDHGVHNVEGDADATNESYDHLHDVFISIINEGHGDELFRLYNDPEPSVQCWAAAHTLEIDEERALAKLAELERAKIPHVSTNAKYTILEWKEGNLKFLPR